MHADSPLFLQTDANLVTQVALYSMIPFVIAFSFIVFIFYRQGRETKLKRERLSLELTALRAQMNPHFIFNCLNAIYNEIQANRNEQASRYLQKFTVLTRRVLENSGSKWIELEEDIMMLSSYIELEQFRMRNSFRFGINIDETLNAENIEVPMLLIQPLLENIIWHGFRSKKEYLIKIEVSKKGNYLCYRIEDNGDSESNKSNMSESIGKKKSLGRQLVINQLEAIAQITKSKPGIREYVREHDRMHCTEVMLPYSEIN